MKNICDVCKISGFVYEKKVVDEIFFLCEDCDWSTEDLEIANKLGELIVGLINNHGNKQKK